VGVGLVPGWGDVVDAAALVDVALATRVGVAVGEDVGAAVAAGVGVGALEGEQAPVAEDEPEVF